MMSNGSLGTWTCRKTSILSGFVEKIKKKSIVIASEAKQPSLLSAAFEHKWF